MSGVQWEVVTKSNKGRGSGEQRNKITRGQKKQFLEKMPKLEEMPPIQESQTIFEAFLEQERKREQSGHKANGKVEPLSKKLSGQQKKKQQDKKKNQQQTKPPSLDDALAELNTEEFESFLTIVQNRFPDNPNIWLKDLASYLNVKLQFDTPDPVFADKPVGYPSCLLQTSLRMLLINVLNQCTPQTLQLFFEYCLLQLIQGLVKGAPVQGSRIFLQCLAQDKPQIIVANLSKCCDLKTSYQNRQNVCLSILWAAGQAGISNIKCGLKVWLELMLPVLGMRAYSKYVVDYLENLIRLQPSTVNESVLGVQELFSVLDIIYTTSGIPGNLQKQMQVLYPKLKALSYGPNRETLLRNYFPSYLRRLQPSSPSALKQELFSCLVECLTLDRQCYSVWRQLYTKYLVQSSLLMCHLLQNWENLSSSFPAKLLKETLSTFRVTNDELGNHRKTNQDGYEDCVKYCNELLTKMSDWKFPWRSLVLFLIVATSGLLVYDVQIIHGTFRSSKTGQLLKEIGLLSVCEQAWGRIVFYSGKAQNWLQINIPVYYAYTCKMCEPYLRLFWEKFFMLCSYIWHSTSGLRDWFNVNIPPLLQWLSDHVPQYMEMAVLSMIEVCKVLQRFTVWIWNYLLFYLTAVGVWLQENIFVGSLSPENLQRYAGNTVEAFQKYTVSAYQWISHQISAVVSSNK